jgi:hypothetical protein
MWGQTTAQINGSVRDSSNLAVPEAEVKATQTANGALNHDFGCRQIVYLPNLAIGPYILEVTEEGFS